MEFSQVAIIYNPKGGSASQKTINQLVKCFEGQGVKVSCLKTTPARDSAVELTRKAVAEGAELLVSFGGDGTACKVVQGLKVCREVMGVEIPMAVFPGGTGNVFARSFYCDPTPAEFVEMVLNGTPQPVDVIKASYRDLNGKLQEHVFMVGFGVGTLADAITNSSPMFKRIFGRLVYALKVGWACLWPGARRFDIKTSAGTKSMTAAAVFALNVTPPMMSSLSLGCNSADGLMDVVVFRARNVWQLMTVAFWIAIRRPQKSRHYRRLRVSELTISSEHPMLPNIDGDGGEMCTEIKLKVEPGTVRMVLA